MTELRIVPEEEPETEPRAASSALRYYASELKRHREAAGLTQAQLADLIPYSKSMISMVETAKRSPLDTRESGRITSKFTEYCDEVLQTGGALGRILPLLDGSNDPYPPWFKPYAHLEAEATAIHIFQSQTIPGSSKQRLMRGLCLPVGARAWVMTRSSVRQRPGCNASRSFDATARQQ